jgi:hypothetical protein
VEAVTAADAAGRTIVAVLMVVLLAAAPARADDAVTITVTTAPVLGVDQEAEVRIEIGDSVSPPRDAPRILASTGRVEDLVRAGPRSFVGRYLLPPERFPQAAILVAEVGDPPLRGFTVFALRAAASPAFRTDPGANVTLRIGDKDFGPQRAARDGSVRVPVVVPPGINYGTARSVNEFGEATEQTVELRVPAFRRLLVAAPDVLAAGSVQEVAIFAVDAMGFPIEPAGVVLSTSNGKAEPLGGRRGEARFLVRAPVAVGQGPLRLEAALRAEADVTLAFELPLGPGPARRLVLRPDRGRLPLHAGSSMRVYLAAADLFGNPVDASAATMLVDGEPVETSGDENGQTMAIVRAPAGQAAHDHLELEAALGETYVAQRIPLANFLGPRQGDGLPSLIMTTRLGLVWSLRRQPGAALLLEVLARRQRWPPWLLAGLSLGLVSLESSAADQLGISQVTLLQLPLLAVVRYQRRLERGLLVGVGIGLGATWTEARVNSFGRDVTGDRLALTGELGGDVAVRLRAGQMVIGLRYLVVRGGRLSSGDELRGNTGGLVADLGYRLAW